MSVTYQVPRTIILASHPDLVIVGDLVASAAITPGMLVEKFSDAGVLKVRANSSATEIPEMSVLLNNPERNQGIDDAVAALDLVDVWMLQVGDVFYGIVPSGQNIAVGDLLQSNGDGKLKEATASTSDANLGKFRSLSALGAVTSDTRCRVERIQ